MTMLQQGQGYGNEEHGPCQICGRATRLFCYKIFVCSACTMFYRRNFRNFGRIRCRFIDEKCKLNSGPRRFCMKCRLKACRNVGLRMWGKNLVVQVNGHPKEDTPEEEINDFSSHTICTCEVSQSDECSYMEDGPEEATQASTSSGDDSSSEMDIQIEEDMALKFLKITPIELPHIKGITTLFRQFDEQQKFLSSLQQKTELYDFVSPTLIYMDYIQFAELEPKVLRCAVQLVTNFLVSLDVHEKKIIQTVKQAANHISWYHKVLQSTRQFPQDVEYVSPYTGYYCNLLDLECHFADVDDDILLSKIVKIVRPFFNKFYVTLKEGRALKLHPVEISFLIGKTMLESLGYVNTEVSSYLQNLHSEFSYFTTASGHSSQRITQIIDFGESLKQMVQHSDCISSVMNSYSEDGNIPTYNNIPDHLIYQYINVYKRNKK